MDMFGGHPSKSSLCNSSPSGWYYSIATDLHEIPEGVAIGRTEGVQYAQENIRSA